MKDSLSQSTKVFRYQQVLMKLKAQIQSGVFPVNQRLPSVRELMRIEEISLSTANRVFHELERTGFIYAKDRIGYFALPSITEYATVRAKPRALFDLSGYHLDATLAPRTQMYKVLKDFARNSQHNHMRPLEPAGYLGLRRCIARIMAMRNVTCGPDDIVILEGEGNMLELVLCSVASKGGVIAIESPSQPILRQFLHRLGINWIEIDTDPIHGINLHSLEILITSPGLCGVWLTPTLQHPLGYSLQNDCRMGIAALMEKHHIPLIEDDACFDLHDGNTSLRPIRHFYRGNNTIYLSSFTKVLVPGYQIGWCLPGSFHASILNQICQRHLCSSPLQQMVLADFLKTEAYETHTSYLTGLFAHYRIRLEEIIRKHFPPDTHLSQPEGGFSYWVKLPEGVDTDQVQCQALATGIIVTPVSGVKHLGSVLSMSIGRHWNQELEQAIMKVGNLCTKLTKN